MPVIPESSLALPAPSASPELSAPLKPSPTFDPSSVSVIFVLGGPGAGKGTQCAFLVRDYGFTHLSAGDLLRAEQDRPNSQFGGMIRETIREGRIVPMEVTVQLLENALEEAISDKGGKGKFLIDGFPRKMDQAIKFDEQVCPSAFTLFFEVAESVLQDRLINRGKTSGRSDDNIDSIKKRFKTFLETSMPVVEYFEEKGKVERVDGTKGPEEVYREAVKRMGNRGFEMLEKDKEKEKEKEEEVES